MTIKQAGTELMKKLREIYPQTEASAMTMLVMEKIAGSREALLLNSDQPISKEQEDILQHHTALLLKHTPLQYVLEEAWFYGLKFYVNEHVLIPRPETEELVHWIIKDCGLNDRAATGNILDIGTGSGCIPIALKKNLPAYNVTAIDVSAGALEVAKKNAIDNGVNISLSRTDILNEAERDQLPVYDIIVSNPPYITHAEKDAIEKNVLEHEPHLALFVDHDDPLLFYRHIAAFGQNHLVNGGAVYIEINSTLGASTKAIFANEGYKNIELKKDMQGKDRMIKAIR